MARRAVPNMPVAISGLSWAMAAAALEVDPPELPLAVELGEVLPEPDPDPEEDVGEAVPVEAGAEEAALATAPTLELPQTMVLLQLACWAWDWALALRQSPRAWLQMKLSMVGL